MEIKDTQKSCEQFKIQESSTVEGLSAVGLVADVSVHMHGIALLGNLSSNSAYCVAVKATRSKNHNRRCSHISDWKRLPCKDNTFKILFKILTR